MSTPPAPPPLITKMTPVVLVDRIEPLLPFYVDALGFTAVAEVPHPHPDGQRLGFVMLVAAPVELMFQTVHSAQADAARPGLAPTPTCLYFDVVDLDRAVAALRDAPIDVPRRTTSYGMEEVFVRDPAGNTVGLARPVKP